MCALRKKDTLKSEVKLFGSRIKKEDRIYFSYRYNPSIDKILKIKCTRDIQRNAYFVRSDELKSVKILEDLFPVAKVKINDSLKISDIDILKLLLEQSYDKSIYKLCPISYLEIMHARNLSSTTIRTYHYYLFQFLNAYPSLTIAQIDKLESVDVNMYHQKMAQSGVFIWNTSSIHQQHQVFITNM